MAKLGFTPPDTELCTSSFGDNTTVSQARYSALLASAVHAVWVRLVGLDVGGKELDREEVL